MGIDKQTLEEVHALGQSCEEVARATLGVGQRLLKAKHIQQDVFDKVYEEYSAAMQKARDMYYQASHNLLQKVLASADLKRLTAETAALNRSLVRLQETEEMLAISLTMVTLVTAIAGAVIAPSTESLQSAYDAAKSAKSTIGI